MAVVRWPPTRVWDYPSGAFLRTITAHDDSVQCIAFSQHGSMMLSTAMDHSVILWDTESGTKLDRFGEDSGTRENIRRARFYAHAPDTPAVRPPDADIPLSTGPRGYYDRPIAKLLKIPA